MFWHNLWYSYLINYRHSLTHSLNNSLTHSLCLVWIRLGWCVPGGRGSDFWYWSWSLYWCWCLTRKLQISVRSETVERKELIVIPLSLIDDPRVMNLKYTFHPISVYTKSSTQHLGSWNLHCFLVCIWTKIWEYFPSFLLSFTHLISIHSRISYIERYSCMHQSVITIICPIRAIYLPSEQWDGKTGVLVDLVLCAKCSFL